MRNLYLISVVLILGIIVSSCSSNQMSFDTNALSETRAQIQLNINTSGGNHYQSELNELRLLMFKSKTGECVYNDLLTINYNEDLSLFKESRTLQFDALELEKGTYDFVLIGNEQSTITNLSAYREALKAVRHINDLDQDIFQKINYEYKQTGGLLKKEWYIHPKGPLLMSAYKQNVNIRGGTEREPQRIRATLVAALSLVELVIKNGWQKAGLAGPSIKPLTAKITDIEIINVVKYFSNPAVVDLPELNSSIFTKSQLINLLLEEGNIPNKNYLQTDIASFQFYIPEHLTSDAKKPTTIQLKTNGIGISRNVNIPIRTNQKLFLGDILAYPRIFNNKTYASKYLQSLHDIKEEDTFSHLRNVRYRIEVYLLPDDQKVEIEIIVNNWKRQDLILNFDKEGSLEHSSVINRK